MKQLIISLLIFFFVLCIEPVIAADNNLSLKEAITISLENNNRYRIAREKVHEKELEVQEVWGEL